VEAVYGRSEDEDSETLADAGPLAKVCVRVSDASGSCDITLRDGAAVPGARLQPGHFVLIQGVSTTR
jgi:hypothetical protein